jgi:hypothetical protein
MPTKFMCLMEAAAALLPVPSSPSAGGWTWCPDPLAGLEAQT